MPLIHPILMGMEFVLSRQVEREIDSLLVLGGEDSLESVVAIDIVNASH